MKQLIQWEINDSFFFMVIDQNINFFYNDKELISE